MLNITATTKEAYRLFHEGTMTLARTEQQGMCVDVDYCKRQKKLLARKIARLEKRFVGSKLAKQWKHVFKEKTNYDSNPQLGTLLYKVRKITPLKETKTGQGATDVEALEGLGIPELETFIQIKKLKKVRETYIEGFLREQVDGVVHAMFNLNVAISYRSSASYINLQNIPKRDEELMQICRRAIIPRSGHQIAEIDFSTLEVLIACCAHKDKKMITDVLRGDMHTDMAKKIFRIQDFDKSKSEHKLLRNATKNGFVFPQFYGDYYVNNAIHLAKKWGKLPDHKRWKAGMGVPMPGGIHLADHLIAEGIPTYQHFEEHLQKIEKYFWHTRYKKYGKWREDWFAEYQKNGYFLNFTGFKFSGLMRKNQVINYIIQSSAFHCLLWSMIELDRLIRKQKLNTRIISQIHDAILFDVDPNELNYVLQLAQEVMCERLPKAWRWITVPLSVEADMCVVDAPWSEKHSYTI